MVWEDPEFQSRLADERDPVLSPLTMDPRLPAAINMSNAEEQLKFAAKTSAKMMRAAHQGQTALNKARLFDCPDLPAERILHGDGVSVQILKRLAAQVRKLDEVPLEDGESELDRQVKIAQILTLMTKQQAVMEQQIAKAVGISLRAQNDGARLMHEIQKHKDMMSLKQDNLTAADVEKIADG